MRTKCVTRGSGGSHISPFGFRIITIHSDVFGTFLSSFICCQLHSTAISAQLGSSLAVAGRRHGGSTSGSSTATSSLARTPSLPLFAATPAVF